MSKIEKQEAKYNQLISNLRELKENYESNKEGEESNPEEQLHTLSTKIANELENGQED